MNGSRQFLRTLAADGEYFPLCGHFLQTKKPRIRTSTFPVWGSRCSVEWSPLLKMEEIPQNLRTSTQNKVNSQEIFLIRDPLQYPNSSTRAASMKWSNQHPPIRKVCRLRPRAAPQSFARGALPRPPVTRLKTRKDWKFLSRDDDNFLPNHDRHT